MTTSSLAIQNDTPPAASVAILMTTFNGERFLVEQLDSLARQTHRGWKVYVSDDGSTDGTLAILTRYQSRWGSDRLTILDGPRKGFAANFLSMVRNRNIDATYFSFCDQDDIWYEDKLARSIRRLEMLPASLPALFCSRTRLIDLRGKVIGHSPLFRKKPSFHNALVQNLAGANTMLFNRRARDLMARVLPGVHVVSHDWLAYLLTTGCGGSVCYDVEPTLGYRQHDNNLVGSNVTTSARLVRIRKLLTGTLREWNRHNLKMLESFDDALTDSALEDLYRYSEACNHSLLGRLRMFSNPGVYHQTVLGNAGLLFAAVLGRV